MSIATVSVIAGGEEITVKAGESTTCVFNVSNGNAERVRVGITVDADPPADAGWFSVQGNTEHDLMPGSNVQVNLGVRVPADATAQRYSFRLRVYSTADTERVVDSPTIALTVPAAAVPGPEPTATATPTPGKPFPWLIVGIAVGVLALAGVLTAVFWPRGSGPIDPPDPVNPPPLAEGEIVCIASGIIKNGGWALLGNMRDDCEPAGRLIFNLNNHANTSRVDVRQNGEIVWVAGGKDHSWVSLDGIVYKPGDGGDALNLSNGWVDYGGDYRPARVARVGGLCVVTGLIKNGGWNTLAVLPAQCRPSRTLIFNLNNHESTARVDVKPSGEIAWVAGGRNHNWINLDGIVFNPGDGGQPLALSNGWSEYSSNYRSGRVAQVGDLCVVSGLIKGANWGSLALLPEQCRPSGRLIFNLNNHESTARVDVKPSGEILWVAGGSNHSWISLTGIVFRPGDGGDAALLLNNWANYGGEYRPSAVSAVTLR